MESSSHSSFLPDNPEEGVGRADGQRGSVLPKTGNFAMRMGGEQNIPNRAEKPKEAPALHFLPNVIYERPQQPKAEAAPASAPGTWAHTPVVRPAGRSTFGNQEQQPSAQQSGSFRPEAVAASQEEENIQGNIHLEKGQRLARDGAGAYAEVVDQHNRVVGNSAFQHGHEFQNEQAHERQVDPLASTPRPAAYVPTQQQPPQPQPQTLQQPQPQPEPVYAPARQQYQAPRQHTASSPGSVQQPVYQQPQAQYSPAIYYGEQALPSGITEPPLQPGPPAHQDPQHLLAASRSKKVLANPWLWVLFVLLLVAFFGGAFIG